jgi:hypothetical protein
MQTRGFAFVLSASISLFAETAVAQDEAGCVGARYKAARKYASCVADAKSDLDFSRFSTCRRRYAAAAPKLQARFPMTSCDSPRYENMGETVRDNLTGLVWEKKSNANFFANPADPHDADNYYGWTSDPSDGDDSDGDGTLYTEFLAALNGGAGFAGTNDWRIPTLEELQTILLPIDAPCWPDSCVDPVFEPVPLFGGGTWSATTNATSSTSVWVADFKDGGIDTQDKLWIGFVRGVRGGW